jgi:glycosyltransferase involved in cell wall biosynthesis
MKIALALIVKGTPEEAELLSRCLDSVSSQVGDDGLAIDGVFITRTHRPGEEPEPAIEKVLDFYKDNFAVHLSDFEWINDFSAARNFNFSQVPPEYDYILWCDADDVWRGLEKLKPLVADHSSVDAFSFEYLYDWDEFKNPTVVHRKTMLLKNDGCVKWVGALHEDFEESRRLEMFLVKGIERMHLTNGDRVAENAKRNVEIATIQATEDPNDPRSHWNLANSCFAVSDYEGARKSFETFLESTESEDEKYLALTRIADVYKSQGNRMETIKHLQTAIGLKPELPDAYLQLAFAHFSFGNMDKAEEYCLTGLQRRPQPDRMIVFNPRDYDYIPLRLLAHIYYEKNRPDLMVPVLEGCLKIYPEDKKLKNLVKEGKKMKEELGKALMAAERLEKITDIEKLREEMDKLPEEIRSHPAICVLRNKHFVKETASGKDLVIYCGMTEHQWNPDLFKTKGFGGSEEAVIHLAREWAELGWNVTVYNNCGHKEIKSYSGSDRGVTRGRNDRVCVTYKPFWEWNYRDKQDVTILWRWVKPVDANINTTKLFVDVHDVIPEGEFTEKRLKQIDKIFVKTQFHRSLFPNVPDEKIAVVPNGFESYLDPSIEKDPMLVINTSSPDRSMDVLPKLWKRVKEQVPEAKMKWAYGFDVYKASFANDPKKMKWMEDTIAEMNDAGIEQLGKIPQHEVAKLYQQASFLAYPTEFAEISCISVLKAQAAKCAIVATDFGALNESVEYGYLVHSDKDKDSWSRPYQFHFGLEDEEAQDEWVDWMVKLLEEGPRPEDYWRDLPEWREKYRWENVASRWNEILCN